MFQVPDVITAFNVTIPPLDVTVNDIPFRFLPCMVAGLAYYLSIKSPAVDPNRVAFLQSDYEKQWDLASQEDREKASIRFVPRNMSYIR